MIQRMLVCLYIMIELILRLWKKFIVIIIYTDIMCHNPMYIDYHCIIMYLINMYVLTNVIELLNNLFSHVLLFLSLHNCFYPIKWSQIHPKKSQIMQYSYRKLCKLLKSLMTYKIIEKLMLLHSYIHNNLKNVSDWDPTHIINVKSSFIYCIITYYTHNIKNLSQNIMVLKLKRLCLFLKSLMVGFKILRLKTQLLKIKS